MSARNAVAEADAGEMWCPETRALYADEDGSGASYNVNKSVNGGKPRFEFATCVGSRCMMWRYVDDGHNYGYCGKGGQP